MADVGYPSLYQINTRVWLTELSRALGKRATLDDMPDVELDRLAVMGFDWVWLLSVWQTGTAGQKISRANSEWRKDFEATLPDLREEDIAGSGFAIQNYTVHCDLGGAAALARLRRRMQTRGLKLILDFVPNHMAPDHPWIDKHPDYFVHGNENDLRRAPQNYCRAQTKNGPLVLAYGRDPYFDGWPDTLQLNYGNPKLQEAMIGELERIAGQCDGLRCDMAMLVLPEVFERTWGIQAQPFWPRATEQVRKKFPQFLFMAEVYWDLECVPAWEGNWTWDGFLPFAWEGKNAERLLVTVNYAPNRSQCYVRLPSLNLRAQKWRLKDLLSDARYDRDGNELESHGLYLDMPSWRYHIFSVQEEP